MSGGSSIRPSRRQRAVAIVEVLVGALFLLFSIVALLWDNYHCYECVFSGGLSDGSRLLMWLGFATAAAAILAAQDLWRRPRWRPATQIVLAGLFASLTITVVAGVPTWRTLWPIPRSFTAMTHAGVTVEIPDYVTDASAAVPRLFADIDAIEERSGIRPGGAPIRIRLDPQPERDQHPTDTYGGRYEKPGLIVIAVDTRDLVFRSGWGPQSSLDEDWRFNVGYALARAALATQDYTGMAAGYAYWASHPGQQGLPERLVSYCTANVRTGHPERFHAYGASTNVDSAAIPFMRAESQGGEPRARELFRDLSGRTLDDASYGALVDAAACGAG